MTKIVLNKINNFNSETASLIHEENNQRIEEAFSKSLSRVDPDPMQADLDMNSNNILNVNTLDVKSMKVGGVDTKVTLDQIVEQKELSETYARDVQEKYFQFISLYLGIQSEHPTINPDSSFLTEGAFYFNSINKLFYVYYDEQWLALYATTENILLEENNLGDLKDSVQALRNLGFTDYMITLMTTVNSGPEFFTNVSGASSADLQQCRDEFQVIIDDLTAQIESFNTSIASVQTVIDLEKASIDATVNLMNQKINDLNATLDDQNARINSILNQIQNLSV